MAMGASNCCACWCCCCNTETSARWLGGSVTKSAPDVDGGNGGGYVDDWELASLLAYGGSGVDDGYRKHTGGCACCCTARSIAAGGQRTNAGGGGSGGGGYDDAMC